MYPETKFSFRLLFLSKSAGTKFTIKKVRACQAILILKQAS
jgi:hypothetical protein